MPLPSPHAPLTVRPYDEQPDWTELWQACVAVLDRYPHIRPPAPPERTVTVHRVTIPPAAVEAADVHFHLD